MATASSNTTSGQDVVMSVGFLHNCTNQLEFRKHLDNTLRHRV